MKNSIQSKIINLGFHPATIYNFFRGERGISIKLAKQLAEKTGTDPAVWLLGTPDDIAKAVEKSMGAKQ